MIELPDYNKATNAAYEELQDYDGRYPQIDIFRIVLNHPKIKLRAALERLKTSPFRARFHLSEQDKAYIDQKGLQVIRSHAAEFVAKRLAPAYPQKDGKQTPMRGHPVFVAQHACACCCRGCLEKWYQVPRGRALTEQEQRGIVNLLMAWILVEYQAEQRGKGASHSGS